MGAGNRKQYGIGAYTVDTSRVHAVDSDDVTILSFQCCACGFARALLRAVKIERAMTSTKIDAVLLGLLALAGSILTRIG
jgi:hypothetical protein